MYIQTKIKRCAEILEGYSQMRCLGIVAKRKCSKCGVIDGKYTNEYAPVNREPERDPAMWMLKEEPVGVVIDPKETK